MEEKSIGKEGMEDVVQISVDSTPHRISCFSDLLHSDRVFDNEITFPCGKMIHLEQIEEMRKFFPSPLFRNESEAIVNRNF